MSAPKCNYPRCNNPTNNPSGACYHHQGAKGSTQTPSGMKLGTPPRADTTPEMDIDHPGFEGVKLSEEQLRVLRLGEDAKLSESDLRVWRSIYGDRDNEEDIEEDNDGVKKGNPWGYLG